MQIQIARYKGMTTLATVTAALFVLAGYLRYGWCVGARCVAGLLLLVWLTAAGHYRRRLLKDRRPHRLISILSAIVLLFITAFIGIIPPVPLWTKALVTAISVFVGMRIYLHFAISKRKEPTK